METQGTTTISSGRHALKRLLEDIAGKNVNWNEAETRFQFIDRIIVECLGWPKDSIRLEQHKDGKRTDYELGRPRQAIWEAKKESRTFDLPADPSRRLVADISSLVALGGEAQEALEQVQRYCSDRGVEIGVATNGHQLVAFLATRSDGVAPLEARCLVIRDLEQVFDEFPMLWQMLSPAGVAEARLHRLLKVGEDHQLPPKMSSYILDYPRYRNPNELQSSLRAISELLLIDLVEQPEIKPRFYSECYCESGALSQHALISKQLLAARYAAIFDPSEATPDVKPVNKAKGKTSLTPEIMAEAISHRPIVLLGDVGVGKSSFLEHLMFVSAYEEFREAIYIYIDLGSTGALAADLNQFVLSKIEEQLLEKYGVDTSEEAFVQGVYNLEIRRFESGIFRSLKTSNPQLFDQKLVEFLADRVAVRDTHLKKSIEHLAKARKKQVIVALDNADQRDYKTQQEVYIIAQNLARDWHTAVFVTLWPQTFYQSKQTGALTAYPHRVFTIAPPRTDLVVDRRLAFALSMAEGKIQIDSLKDVGIQLGNIALFLKALIFSLKKNIELVEFLANITGGNIRSVVELVAHFIGSSNVDAAKIIKSMEETGEYHVAVHEFWKASMLGDFYFYDPVASPTLNLFDFSNADVREHFLLPILLAFLDLEGAHRSKEGFVAIDTILEAMQNIGFNTNATKIAVGRADRKKLVETSQRATFDVEKSSSLGRSINFRITTIGAYHVKRWIGDFAYLDAMAYDTPILDPQVRDLIRPRIGSISTSDRYNRAIVFRTYLTKAWHSSNLRVPYFDWDDLISAGNRSFEKVKQFIDKRPVISG